MLGISGARAVVAFAAWRKGQGGGIACFVFVCVHACAYACAGVRADVRARARAFACAGACLCLCVWVCVCNGRLAIAGICWL